MEARNSIPLYRSAARSVPGTCLVQPSSTVHTPASGAVDSCRFGGRSVSYVCAYLKDKLCYNYARVYKFIYRNTKLGQELRRIQSRRRATATIAELVEHPEQVIVIHYSCESFYNRPDGLSPRITSIAVRRLHSGITDSFSIHQVAEEKGYDIAALDQHYNQLEKMMLDRFYDYARANGNYKWLHWNMRDINYGFPALAHRYRVLKGKPHVFDENKLHDLSRLLLDLYGINYIEHPRLENVMKKNNFTNKDFLTGKQEAEAFEKGEYVKLHQSTLRKVDIFADLLKRSDGDALKTNTTWRDKYGNIPQALSEIIQENWLLSTIIGITAFISAVLGIITFFM